MVPHLAGTGASASTGDTMTASIILGILAAVLVIWLNQNNPNPPTSMWGGV